VTALRTPVKPYSPVEANILRPLSFKLRQVSSRSGFIARVEKRLPLESRDDLKAIAVPTGDARYEKPIQFAILAIGKTE
jgi:hypothetical protein